MLMGGQTLAGVMAYGTHDQGHKVYLREADGDLGELC